MTLISELERKDLLNTNRLVIVRERGKSNRMYKATEVPQNLLNRQIVNEGYSQEYASMIFVVGDK